jgi:hypothetical protein
MAIIYLNYSDPTTLRDLSSPTNIFLVLHSFREENMYLSLAI